MPTREGFEVETAPVETNDLALEMLIGDPESDASKKPKTEAEWAAEQHQWQTDLEAERKKTADLGQGNVLADIMKKQQQLQETMLDRQRPTEPAPAAYGIPKDDPLWKELGEVFMQDPAEAFRRYHMAAEQRSILPIGQGLMRELQGTRSEVARDRLLQDESNKTVYSRWQGEVEAEMRHLGSASVENAERALQIVKGRHAVELIQDEVKRQLAAKDAEGEVDPKAPVGAAKKPGNVQPSLNGNRGPETAVAGKPKFYFASDEQRLQLMARKPMGLTERDYLDYLADSGKIKRT